jgi:hypothetical protein
MSLEKYLLEKALEDQKGKDWLDAEEKGELAMREVESFIDWAWKLWKAGFINP